MKANINKAYAEQAMQVIENVVASSFLLALSRVENFGPKRLNRIKDEATKVAAEYCEKYGNKSEYRGNKYKTGAIIQDMMIIHVKRLGVDLESESEDDTNAKGN